jgi:hypothetical protein
MRAFMGAILEEILHCERFWGAMSDIRSNLWSHFGSLFCFFIITLVGVFLERKLTIVPH